MYIFFYSQAVTAFDIFSSSPSRIASLPSGTNIYKVKGFMPIYLPVNNLLFEDQS